VGVTGTLSGDRPFFDYQRLANQFKIQMKTRAQAQLQNEQPPANVDELQRLKALFEKRPVARQIRIKK